MCMRNMRIPLSRKPLKRNKQKALTPKALGALPHELLTRLEQALMDGDTDRVESLTEDIRLYNTALADALAVMVADFEYAKFEINRNIWKRRE